MKQATFKGRKPIFVGDDVTDEAGMQAAIELGGMGLRVSEYFDGDPARVREWLLRGLRRMGGSLPQPADKPAVAP